MANTDDEAINICELPDDSLQEIVSYVGIGDWFSLLQTNKRWAPILKRIDQKIMVTIFGSNKLWELFGDLSVLQKTLLIACDGPEFLLATRMYLTLQGIPYFHYNRSGKEASFRPFLRQGHKIIISLTEDTHGCKLDGFDSTTRFSLGYDRKWDYRYANIGNIYYLSPLPIIKQINALLS